MTDPTARGPILRLFYVEAEPGCAQELVQSFATTSADVVKAEPGNRGYFFGRCLEVEGDVVIFASVWEDLDAIRTRFGDAWRDSFLPDGYAEKIRSHWVRHITLDGGWHVAL